MAQNEPEYDPMQVALEHNEQMMRRYTERKVARDASRSEGMIKTTIRQTRGPKLVFTGRKIAEVEFTTQGREPLSWLLEIWETAGGAYIALSSSLPAGRSDGNEDVRCTVVEPGEHGADRQAMQFAVMDHFDWTQRAKDMVRKQLKWKLVRVVA